MVDEHIVPSGQDRGSIVRFWRQCDVEVLEIQHPVLNAIHIEEVLPEMPRVAFNSRPVLRYGICPVYVMGVPVSETSRSLVPTQVPPAPRLAEEFHHVLWLQVRMDVCVDEWSVRRAQVPFT